MSVMVPAMATGQKKGDQPELNQSWAACIFFIAFIFICSFTLLNLYLGERVKGESMGMGLGLEVRVWGLGFRFENLEPVH